MDMTDHVSRLCCTIVIVMCVLFAPVSSVAATVTIDARGRPVSLSPATPEAEVPTGSDVAIFNASRVSIRGRTLGDVTVTLFRAGAPLRHADWCSLGQNGSSMSVLVYMEEVTCDNIVVSGVAEPSQPFMIHGSTRITLRRVQARALTVAGSCIEDMNVSSTEFSGSVTLRDNGVAPGGSIAFDDVSVVSSGDLQSGVVGIHRTILDVAHAVQIMNCSLSATGSWGTKSQNRFLSATAINGSRAAGSSVVVRVSDTGFVARGSYMHFAMSFVPGMLPLHLTLTNTTVRRVSVALSIADSHDRVSIESNRSDFEAGSIVVDSIGNTVVALRDCLVLSLAATSMPSAHVLLAGGRVRGLVSWSPRNQTGSLQINNVSCGMQCLLRSISCHSRPSIRRAEIDFATATVVDGMIVDSWVLASFVTVQSLVVTASMVPSLNLSHIIFQRSVMLSGCSFRHMHATIDVTGCVFLRFNIGHSVSRFGIHDCDGLNVSAVSFNNTTLVSEASWAGPSNSAHIGFSRSNFSDGVHFFSNVSCTTYGSYVDACIQYREGTRAANVSIAVTNVHMYGAGERRLIRLHDETNEGMRLEVHGCTGLNVVLLAQHIVCEISNSIVPGSVSMDRVVNGTMVIRNSRIGTLLRVSESAPTTTRPMPPSRAGNSRVVLSNVSGMPASLLQALWGEAAVGNSSTVSHMFLGFDARVEIVGMRIRDWQLTTGAVIESWTATTVSIPTPTFEDLTVSRDLRFVTCHFQPTPSGGGSRLQVSRVHFARSYTAQGRILFSSCDLSSVRHFAVSDSVFSSYTSWGRPRGHIRFVTSPSPSTALHTYASSVFDNHNYMRAAVEYDATSTPPGTVSMSNVSGLKIEGTLLVGSASAWFGTVCVDSTRGTKLVVSGAELSALVSNSSITEIAVTSASSLRGGIVDTSSDTITAQGGSPQSIERFQLRNVSSGRLLQTLSGYAMKHRNQFRIALSPTATDDVLEGVHVVAYRLRRAGLTTIRNLDAIECSLPDFALDRVRILGTVAFLRSTIRGPIVISNVDFAPTHIRSGTRGRLDFRHCDFRLVKFVGIQGCTFTTRGSWTTRSTNSHVFFANTSFSKSSPVSHVYDRIVLGADNSYVRQGITYDRHCDFDGRMQITVTSVRPGPQRDTSSLVWLASWSRANVTSVIRNSSGAATDISGGNVTVDVYNSTLNSFVAGASQALVVSCVECSSNFVHLSSSGFAGGQNASQLQASLIRLSTKATREKFNLTHRPNVSSMAFQTPSHGNSATLLVDSVVTSPLHFSGATFNEVSLKNSHIASVQFEDVTVRRQFRLDGCTIGLNRSAESISSQVGNVTVTPRLALIRAVMPRFSISSGSRVTITDCSLANTEVLFANSTMELSGSWTSPGSFISFSQSSFEHGARLNVVNSTFVDANSYIRRVVLYRDGNDGLRHVSVALVNVSVAFQGTPEGVVVAPGPPREMCVYTLRAGSAPTYSSPIPLPASATERCPLQPPASITGDRNVPVGTYEVTAVWQLPSGPMCRWSATRAECTWPIVHANVNESLHTEGLELEPGRCEPAPRTVSQTRSSTSSATRPQTHSLSRDRSRSEWRRRSASHSASASVVSRESAKPTPIAAPTDRGQTHSQTVEHGVVDTSREQTLTRNHFVSPERTALSDEDIDDIQRSATTEANEPASASAAAVTVAASRLVSPSAAGRIPAFGATLRAASCGGGAGPSTDLSRLEYPLQMDIGNGPWASRAGSGLLSALVVLGSCLPHIVALFTVTRRASARTTLPDSLRRWPAQAWAVGSVIILAYLGPGVVGAGVGSMGWGTGAQAAAGAVSLLVVFGTYASMFGVSMRHLARQLILLDARTAKLNKADDEQTNASESQNTGIDAFTSMAGPLYMPARVPTEIGSRVWYFEDVGFAMFQGLVGGVESGGGAGCLTLLSTLALAGLAHCGYIVLVRPYESHADGAFAFLNGLIVCFVAVAGAAAPNSSGTLLESAAVAQTVVFVLQPIVIVTVECVKRRFNGGGDTSQHSRKAAVDEEEGSAVLLLPRPAGPLLAAPSNAPASDDRSSDALRDNHHASTSGSAFRPPRRPTRSPSTPSSSATRHSGNERADLSRSRARNQNSSGGNSSEDDAAAHGRDVVINPLATSSHFRAS